MRVAHSRDGEKAVEELASPPGDRKHRQAADRGAAGGTARSRAEPQLRDRRALTGLLAPGDKTRVH
ncbi:hypothetical protein PAL_GLEAN10016562 [Pteropus alecto]|uniref:Uncharacterized protein n=1 Tax=Pteropus alecto TaxID=9402 RepID=L5L235_PTEAL|nr:hypothetical protein PAL_GLEAN10016562 [Pteropus alecto]